MSENLEEALKQQQLQIQSLQFELNESLGQLDFLLDRNWVSLFGGLSERAEGPDLTQLHEVSKRNRELAALNVHVKNGLRARSSYIWKGGIQYNGIPGRSQGRGVNVQARIDDRINQRYFFSQQAREEREAALYCDSQVFYYGDDLDYRIRPIPVSEITDDLRNPNQSDEVWAYRRSWSEYTLSGEVIPRVEWLFLNAFWDRKPKGNRITYKDMVEPVSPTKRIFGTPVNSFIGWAYGVPDVLCAIGWAENYRRAINNGERITESMASIWAQMKHNTSAGASDAAIKFGSAAGAGGVAHMGTSQELSILPSAGNAYKFSDLLPILANFAAGLGVSVIDVSANPGNAGGSYGAAKSLQPVTIAMSEARRAYHVDLDREVLLWLGAKEDELDVWFDPIIDPTEKYREYQGIAMKLGTGLYTGEEIKAELERVAGRTHFEPVPEGWLLPNNEKSLALKGIDTDSENPANGGSFTPTQGSGQRFGNGGQGDQKSDDIRTNRDEE